ncbi:MAG: MBL fold metallo-hydrolase [Bdellovibrionales bacterium]|nr:MBL fold metallo-hydrolase [Bdellovibrionales bacterium]
MKLTFLGGAQTVTGSKTLFEYGKTRILVDCGLFQGLKELRLRNWDALPIDASAIDAVVLTHAHLDHSGYLPVLNARGFRGKIYCSAPTRELSRLILLDSAKLSEEDADFANREGYSKHRPALPIYDRKAVQEVMERFHAVPSGKWISIGPEVKIRLSPSGHILGSTFVEIEAGGKRVVFSGDVGRKHPTLYDSPVRLERADTVVVEATYGDRNHLEESASIDRRLIEAVRETHSRGGHVLIPAFSVGRVQEILYRLSTLKRRRELPEIPVYLDSPMGIEATRIFTEFPAWHRLEREEVDRLCKTAIAVKSRSESIRIMREDAPAIVIAGSGMLAGGRILHHLAARIGDPRSTVLLVGYQAAGTRGRLLQDGASEVKMHGRYFPVRARIATIPGLSAHGDQSDLLDFVRGFETPPKRIFLNHGEPQALDALRVKIKDTLGQDAVIPHLGERFDLSPFPEVVAARGVSHWPDL